MLLDVLYRNMRLTVDIPDDMLTELRRLSNIKKNSPAVAKAVADYVRIEKAKAFSQSLRVGEFDYPMSNVEDERLHG